MAVDSPIGHPGVNELLDGALIFSTRAVVKLAGAAHAQGLLGALLVKGLAPKIQRILADPWSKAFEFESNVAVQSFMGPVVLGVTRAPSL